MAKYSSGIMGHLSGQIGNVIASSWKGIPYLKSAHKPRTLKISQKERANRLKFKRAQEWLGPLLDFVREGYKGYSLTVEGFSAAKSYLMKNAMDPDGNINPALMKVSFGNLSLSENIRVKPTGDGQLQFDWDIAEVKDGNGLDQVMLLAYDIENCFATYSTLGAFRYAGTDILYAPFRHGGGSCHIYLAFVSADRSRQSDSIYLGEIGY